MLRASFRIAVRALGRHKLRTALTTLGLTIGVAAVITMVALGTGASDSVSSDIKSAGTNLIRVDAGNFTRGGEESNIATGLGQASTLMPSDADAIRGIAGVKYAAAGVKLRSWVSGGTGKEYVQVLGTDATYAPIYGWKPSRGAFFATSDVQSAAPVAVVGRALSDRLFGPGTNSVGRNLKIRDSIFRVVGIVAGNDEDQAGMAYVPFTSLQRVLGIQNLHTVLVAAGQAGDATRIADDIKTLLRARHRLDTDAAVARLRQGGLLGNQAPSSGSGLVPDDFTVKTQAAEELTKGLYTSVAAFVLANMPKVDEANLQEMTGTLSRAGTTMTALLAAIAAISLVVGGIGIMNIMLVSVTERTREIGIRRALGARSRDVLLQFLVEAVTLSCSGGMIGIVLGFVGAFAIARLLEWPTSVSPWSVVLAFGIAGAIGVFFGFYPAHRASRLHPIDALRTE
jgi:putative ABC transport system permease protein